MTTNILQMTPSREGHDVIFLCVVTIRVIPKTFLQNFMRKCLTILRKKRNIKKHKIVKNNTKCLPSPGMGDRCELYYVCEHLSKVSKVHMQSFRKNVQ